MSVRNKLIGAVLATGALTAVVSASELTAWAGQPAASSSATAPVAAKENKNLPRAAKLLAADLKIPYEQALQVLRDIQGFVPKGDSTHDPRFVAIAKGVGVTPQRLHDAIVAVKMKL
jgi:hypothetical protein